MLPDQFYRTVKVNKSKNIMKPCSEHLSMSTSLEQLLHYYDIECCVKFRNHLQKKSEIFKAVTIGENSSIRKAVLLLKTPVLTSSFKSLDGKNIVAVK